MNINEINLLLFCIFQYFTQAIAHSTENFLDQVQKTSSGLKLIKKNNLKAEN